MTSKELRQKLYDIGWVVDTIIDHQLSANATNSNICQHFWKISKNKRVFALIYAFAPFFRL
jgi:hypothetical protein